MFSAIKTGVNSQSAVINRSLRVLSGSYLNRTFGTRSGNDFTFSCWIKLGAYAALSGNYQAIFGTTAGSGFSGLAVGNGQFAIFNSSGNITATTNGYYDSTAWYNVVFTRSAGLNQTRVYVNGSNTNSGIGAFASNVGNSGTAHYIGQNGNSANYLEASIANAIFVDGSSLIPANFGKTDPTTGNWVPISYTGTYGNNGFFLPFTSITSTTTLGNDFSGNSNNWTTNGFSLSTTPANLPSYASSYDVPVNSPANVLVGNYVSLQSVPYTNLRNINLGIYGSSNSIVAQTTVPFRFSGGTSGYSPVSYYWEIINTGSNSSTSYSIPGTGWVLNLNYSGQIGFYYNTTDNYIYYTTNGSTYTPVATSLAGKTGIFNITPGSTYTSNFNGGQLPFAFTPPAGTQPINSNSVVVTSGIISAGTQIQATKYLGNGTSRTVTNNQFEPGLIWISGNNANLNTPMVNSLVGTRYQTLSNSDAAQTFNAQGVTAFTSTGFTVGSNADYNTNSGEYVAWQWKSSGTTVSNSNGTTPSSVRANQTSGFSVISYTGQASTTTIGHGLAKAPEFMIFKCADAGGAGKDPIVYHASLGNTAGLLLNSTNALSTSSGYWNNTTPTSTVVSLGTATQVATAAQIYNAYCWNSVPGYSAFGSYQGQGTNEFLPIILGFKPRILIIKCSSVAGTYWQVFDSARNAVNTLYFSSSVNTLNPYTWTTYPDNITITPISFFATGFQPQPTIRAPDSVNANGATYVYAAFADTDFKFATAF
jgi:hypothetical protein